ncbi:predicted protein [Plenodomus lingam JN3]|uniref:Predicted protein n=1 Tax=Leptosphaeria maculans (strain JN3 / isolate v23.1.3 / race Av1-4-5-6-7-8) TaxID=985895 RepID=E5A4V5_LEPMJ|nr:predicted protein [Plenodomus lingam JN3]CBX98653.1 predicted protein [Plenodomus lingam JN3]
MRKVLVVIWLVVGARLRPAFGPNALVSISVRVGMCGHFR